MGHESRGSPSPVRLTSTDCKAVQLPPSLINYILVHELAHLSEANHTPDYWKTIALLMPDYETHKAHLASIGQNIWLGTVSEVWQQPDNPNDYTPMATGLTNEYPSLIVSSDVPGFSMIAECDRAVAVTG